MGNDKPNLDRAMHAMTEFLRLQAAVSSQVPLIAPRDDHDGHDDAAG